jgi:hypothetical protein
MGENRFSMKQYRENEKHLLIFGTFVPSDILSV